MRIQVTASFTAEPLEQPLVFLLEALGHRPQVVFSPFNQVVQQVLDPRSDVRTATEAHQVFLIRPRDLAHDNPSEGLRAFEQALEEYGGRLGRSNLVLFCPHPEKGATGADLEASASARLSALGNVVAGNQELLDLLGTHETFDREAEEAGNVPFTDEGFAALAICIARQLHAWNSPSRKLLVTDADNTLWRGVLGEDGLDGIVIDEPARVLQAFLQTQRKRGFLLALSSKNDAGDVTKVLEEHPGMLLRDDDFVAQKVNWEPKSTNIRELCQELGLGMDSVVFIDDNAAETAEVTAGCPGVLAITLPEDRGEIESMLTQSWAFDLGSPRTEEDERRTELYAAQASRESLQQKSDSFAAFLEGLQLEVDLSVVTSKERDRLAQLSTRTNQFNACKSPFQAHELAEQQAHGAIAHRVAASDRFGQYGVVGAMISESTDRALKVSAFFLSCRALGKGVERHMIRQLGQQALEASLGKIEVAFNDAERNGVCRAFFEEVGAIERDGMFILDAQASADLELIPTSDSSLASNPLPVSRVSVTTWNDVQHVITQWADPGRLADHLAATRSPRPDLSEPVVGPKTPLEKRLLELWEAVLGLEGLGVEDRFSALGGKSLHLVRLHARLVRDFKADISLTDLFELPTVRSLAQRLEGETKSSRIPISTSEREPSEPIAIVGMAVRAPGANSVEEFWANLRDGERTLHSFTDEELASAGVDVAEVRQDPKYVPVKGCLDKLQEFDAAFFGILPKEAKHMDPQQRIFLELAWEALERGGYDPETYAGKVGLWAGSYLDTYVIANLLTDKAFHAQWIPSIQVGSLQTELGNDKDYLATRVSFKLNLRGPSMTVQTACSTSMVAIAQAIQSLRAGESDMAMAGGVTITLPEKKGYYYTEDGMLSKDGRVCTFSDEASGTVFGNGAGIVVLKRLADAQRDGDHIHAVIRGAALNNDGGVKHSYTAPSVDGQVEVITMAQQDAGVEPETISYIEAHGTGTPLGDPIEVAALTKCFRQQTDAKSFCTLGSLKPNIGHLDVASGVCGVIKTALSLEHGQIPPLLHYERPNPKINFETSPFRVQTSLTDWVSDNGPRRAGVSSFGVGGTNGHIVLEEAPTQVERSFSKRPAQLFLMAARTESARDEVASRLAKVSADTNFADAAFTTAIGRRAFAKRRICVAGNWESLSERLSGGKVQDGSPASAADPLNFMFPGQGAQHVGMACELYECEPVFRDHIDFCATYLEEQIGADLRDVLYPEVADEAATNRLKETAFAQPAIFVIETGLAKLWQSWGISPAAMIGHSVGEFAAACIADVFSLKEGLAILATRGKLMGDLPGGAMLAVRLSEDAIQSYVGDADLAAVNGKDLCVLAGSNDMIAAVEARLESDGVTVKHLHTSHGFHSRMMDPVIDPFAAEISKATLRKPEIPIFSTVTGDWLTDADACDPDYWARHLRQPVRFFESIRTLAATQENQTFVEVGPGQTLATLGRQSVGGEGGHGFHASSAPASGGASDYEQLLTTLGRLWLNGADIDWQSYYAIETHRRVVLPPYPFERKRHWVDPTPMTADPNISLALPETNPVPVATTTTTPVIMPTTPPRRDRLAAKMRESLSELSDIPEEELDGDASFLELGFDSLLLTQVSKAFQDDFGTKVTMRQLIDELPSIDAMVDHLDATLDPSAFAPEESPVSAAEAAPAVPAATVTQMAAPALVPTAVMPAAPMSAPTMPAVSADSGLLGTVINQQMTLMQQQLLLLQGGVSAHATAPSPVAAPASAAPIVQELASAPTPTPEPKKDAPTQAAHGPYKPINRIRDEGLSNEQKAFILDLTKRYNAKTAGSKERTQKYRHCFADPRTANGFNRLWKDMCYQIMVEKAKGPRLTDIDGNDYIDIVNGFGPGFLGHSPDFVTEALKDQLDKTIAVGPQSEFAGETAELVCKLVDAERVCFVNTGSEAVQGAMRLARTVTGKDKVVVFSKDYHGNFDEVLVRGANKKGKIKSLPIAPGIPRSAVDEIIVLDYGTDEALQTIGEIAGDIAAVMIEPMQSRRPEFQPVEFVKEVRKITEDAGCLFIFDEVITGFRTGPGGAQDYYGVKADLATYGKVIGGGMPVGLVAGKAEFMDTFDGGQWQYGDDSFPEKPVTFFAGTFVRHPLTIAAVNVMAKFFLDQPQSYWDEVYAKAARLAGTIDQFFADEGIGIRMVQFSSQMFVRVSDEEKYGGLLFCQLREKGVFILEGLPCYLTTSHTDEDIDFVINAVKEAVAEMRQGGFFGGPDGGGDCLGKPLGAQCQTEAALAKAPVTAAQQEIWLASLLKPEASCAFNEATTLHMRGRANRGHLQAALNEVVARHDALRATFSEDGTTMQFAERLTVDLPQYDLTDVDAETRKAKLDVFRREEAMNTFDLVNGPLIRGFVVQLGETESILFLTAHHLVCDGWSYNVLLEELSELYSAKVRGERPSLKPAPAFGRYAMTKAAMNGNDDAMAFWENIYTSPPEPLALPTDRPIVKTDSFTGDTERHVLSKDVFKALKRIGAKQKCTAYQTLLGTFEVFLAKLTGQNDFGVGTPAAGQTLEEDDGIVGHCVNFLPMRARVNQKESFNEHLGGVRQRVLEAFEHQDFTYGELLPKLNLPRQAGRKPLVEVQFNVERTDYHDEFEGLETTFDAVSKRFVNFPLFFNIIDSREGLVIDCDYKTELFDPETIQRWFAHFETLITNLSESPEQPLAEVSLVSLHQSKLLLEKFNNTARDLSSAPLGACVHELFERQVAANSKAIALRRGDDTLSYGALNTRANQFAHRLVEMGVKPGTLVGVLVPRSFDLVAALLGILKAGGAYVPIDPNYPAERIDYVLEDSKAPVLISSEIEDFEGTQVLHPDSLDSGGMVENIGTKACSEDLAYVIYTSGSTGNPKGSMIPHRGIVRLVKNTNYAEFTEEDVFLQAAAISFDASTMELWGPLLNGGSLVLPPPGIPSLEDIGDLIKKHGVTTLWLTSGLFQLMVDEHLDALVGVKQVLAGGDVLSMDHVQRAHAKVTGKLINGYGPTENTTFTCCHTITGVDLTKSSVPIGKPIANTTCYILDPNEQLVPVGIWGELYIGGCGLATGYLNSPELTDEKFLADPFSCEPNAKLYRTGDRCRWQADGTIEFSGRLDKQIKIRGFRIEPGEVETALNALPGIAQSCVTTQGRNAGDRVLVAYVVPSEGQFLDTAEVKGVLADRLPAHLVPSSLMALDALPVTANGKVDLRALPAIQSTQTVAETLEVPSTESEKRLALLWEELLDCKGIGLDDNFFDIGGHSLVGLRLFTRIQSEFGAKLPLGTLFEAPTVRSLASLIEREEAVLSPLEVASPNGKTNGDGPHTNGKSPTNGNGLAASDMLLDVKPIAARASSVTTIQEGSSDVTPIFAIHGGDGGILFYRELVRWLPKETPLYAIEAPMLMDSSKISDQSNIREIADEYLAKVESVKPEGPYSLCGYSFGGVVSYEMAQRLYSRNIEVEKLILFDTPNPAQELENKYSLSQRAQVNWEFLGEEKVGKRIGTIAKRASKGVVSKLKHRREVKHAMTCLENGTPVSDYVRLIQIREVHTRMIERYVPIPYAGKMTLLRATGPNDYCYYSPQLGWEGLVEGGIQVVETPGTHLEIFDEPYVGSLGERMKEILIS